MPQVVQALKGGDQGRQGARRSLMGLVHGGELIKACGGLGYVVSTALPCRAGARQDKFRDQRA